MKVLSDGWTAVTRDRSLSAQFEHSVGVTETWRRNLHPLAQGPAQTALCLNRAATRPDVAASDTDPDGHRERLRARFLKGGADAMPDYELLELTLFAALPRRDTKPLAKALLARFGSFAEVIAAPRARLMEVKGVGEARRQPSQDRGSGRACAWPRPR